MSAGKNIYQIIYLLSLPLIVNFGNITNVSAQKIFTVDLKKIHTYTLGYYMPLLTKPEFQYSHGFTAGFDYIIKYREKNKEKSSFRFSGTDRHLYLDNSVGGYFHLDSTNALYLQTKLTKRITWRVGFKIEGMIGIGYLRSYPSKIYLPEEIPLLKNIKENGMGHFVPSLGVGLGWDFYRCCNVPVSLNIRPGMYFQLPAEKKYKPYYGLEGSVSVSFYKKREKSAWEVVKGIFKKKEKKQ